MPIETLSAKTETISDLILLKIRNRWHDSFDSVLKIPLNHLLQLIIFGHSMRNTRVSTVIAESGTYSRSIKTLRNKLSQIHSPHVSWHNPDHRPRNKRKLCLLGLSTMLLEQCPSRARVTVLPTMQFPSFKHYILYFHYQRGGFCHHFTERLGKPR